MPTTNYYTVNGHIIGESTDGVHTDYLTDALGNVSGTVNSAGALINTYSYKPSGALLAKTGVGADPRFKHVGAHGIATSTRKYAEEYMRRRHYSHTTGAFTTRDPIASGPEFGMPYIYVKQNPTTLIDPSGLRTQGGHWWCNRVPPFGIPPHGPVICNSKWNEFIYNYCNCCYHGPPLGMPIECRQKCDDWAKQYYLACKKPRHGIPWPIFRPWRPGGAIKPFPINQPGIGPPILHKPCPIPSLTPIDCGPSIAECVNAGTPPQWGGAFGFPNTPACRGCCNQIPRHPACGNKHDECQEACSWSHGIWWGAWFGQFGGPTGKMTE